MKPQDQQDNHKGFTTVTEKTLDRKDLFNSTCTSHPSSGQHSLPRGQEHRRIWVCSRLQVTPMKKQDSRTTTCSHWSWRRCSLSNHIRGHSQVSPCTEVSRPSTSDSSQIQKCTASKTPMFPLQTTLNVAAPPSLKRFGKGFYLLHIICVDSSDGCLWKPASLTQLSPLWGKKTMLPLLRFLTLCAKERNREAKTSGQ